ncbi:SDR family NAD(P)-dependent oxidoreductase [Actinomycetospora termitidis]|uniref:SDR family oxidoreductase n=1 Tax=Actinomycetospora termitidis TaxID=3053470 RepID=A0ABT7MEG7_9PSEU|nr:SDR family oxidoreductase [Actinomycetospora sp. Odt1-22]MDL5159060.1 SDR family oxidoreductase [Actinomycetospora sp. Odt1-22]
MLVTGGTGSLGAALCVRFRRDGHVVVAADRSGGKAAPEGVHHAPLDVTDSASVEACLDAVAALGRLTTVVLAHGVMVPVPGREAAGEAMERTLEVNLAGAARVAALAADRMTSGSIVLLSSHASRFGRMPGAAVYSASKAGVEALARGLACEYAPRLRVNAVGVGFVETPMRGAGRDARRAAGNLLEQVPLGRLATHDDVVEAVSFLASDRAAYITGTTLMVDGGVTAR